MWRGYSAPFMAATELSPIGTFIYGALVNPRTNKFNATAWECGLRLTLEEAEPVLAKINDCLANKRKQDPRFPAKDTDLNLPIKPGKTKDESGEYVPDPSSVVVQFKRNFMVRRKDGTQQQGQRPQIYDSTGANVTDQIQDVGFGTKLRVVYEPYAYSGGNFGVQLQIKGVQIVEMAERNEALPPIEGGWVANTGADDNIDSILSSV